MQTCSLCHQKTPASAPFCPSCGHGRIVESLYAPVSWPVWIDKALIAGLTLVGAWFLITLGVAFLREAKAVRWARTAIEQKDTVRAQRLIAPFLQDHPNHVEALYIGGASAIANDQVELAAAHFSTLMRMEKRKANARLEELKVIYSQKIIGHAASLPCGEGPFAGFYERYESLGESLEGVLLRAAVKVASECALVAQRNIANEPGYWLINKKGLDPELIVHALYLEPLGPAIEKGSYPLARGLALQAQSLLPSTTSLVDELLMDLRRRVAKNLKDLRAACAAVRDNPESRARYSCFSSDPPQVLAEHRDAWGRSFDYEPLELRGSSECRRGFKLVSRGADEVLSPTAVDTPDLDVACQYQGGRSLGIYSRFDSFWLPRR